MSAEEILRRVPPRPWCAACGEDWTDEPCCDVRREIRRLEALVAVRTEECELAAANIPCRALDDGRPVARTTGLASAESDRYARLRIDRERASEERRR